MPFYICLGNLIVKKEAIESRYSGGLEQFRTDHMDYNNFWEDEELFSIIAMNVDDIEVDNLISKGLHFDEKAQFSTDFALINRPNHYLWPTDWLVDNGIYVWHKDCNPESVQKANDMLTKTIDEICELYEQGIDPFLPIR
jgi:hypothetical protein